MLSLQERWEIFIDFSAIVHEHLTDMQEELAVATLTVPVTPTTVESLLRLWTKAKFSFDEFIKASEHIKIHPDLGPEQVVMVEQMIRKIQEAAQRTNVTLRVFFQSSELLHLLPSREQSGESLWPH